MGDRPEGGFISPEDQAVLAAEPDAANPQSAEEAGFENTETTAGGEEIANERDIDFGGSPATPYYARAEATVAARKAAEDGDADGQQDSIKPEDGEALSQVTEGGTDTDGVGGADETSAEGDQSEDDESAA